MFKPSVLLVILLAALLAGCGGGDDPQTLTVFAAASLTDSFEELAAAFEAQNENVEVVLNFGASSSLATQLNEGAKADVFASANNQQMQNVQNKHGEPQVFVQNRLAVIAWAESEITTLDDLTQAGLKLVIVAPETPIRGYTDQALAALSVDTPGYQEAFMQNIVSEEATVRAAVLKISLGEADAGILYTSDVTPDIAESVRLIDIPDAYNVIADYPIAAITERALARDFVNFVLSAEGQAILAKWGFIPAP